MDQWHFLFYFVGQRRKDGTAPSLEKAVEERFFLTFDQAKPLLDQVTKEIGDYYGIFPAEAIIPRIKPITAELTTEQYRSLLLGIFPFRQGEKVRLKRDVDRFPHFLAPTGLIGNVLQVTENRLIVKMDQPLPGAEDWENCIHWEDRLEAIPDLELV